MPLRWPVSIIRPIDFGRYIKVAALAIGIAIPTLLAYSLLSDRTRRLNNAERDAGNAALTLKHYAARTIEITDVHLRSVANHIAGDENFVRSQAIHSALRKELDNSRGLGNLVVFDRDGRLVAEALTFPARPLDISDRDYFRVFRNEGQGDVEVGRPIVGALSGNLVLPIARRITGPDGAFAGIVVATLDVAAFQAVYDAIKRDPGTLFSLWRRDGSLLVLTPSVPELIGRNFAAHETYRRHVAVADNSPFWAPSMTDGTERVIAYGFLDGYPLFVGASLARDEVLAPWRNTVWVEGTLGSGLTLILVASLLLLAREIERHQHAVARARLITENATDVFVLGDLDMLPVYVSPAARAVLGYAPEDLVGLNPINLVHNEDRALVADHWAKLQSGQRPDACCVRHRHADGHDVWLEASVSLVSDPDDGRPTGFVASLRDVTARHETEQQMRHMALHDTLTGLPNRTLLQDRLSQAIAYATRTRSPFAVLACDLDRFKAVNDSLGHSAGDALLQVVAERMRSVLRPDDTIARLGGDEFAIVLAYLDEPSSAACMAQHLITTVGEPVDLDGRLVEVGISIGYTVSLGRDGCADELFKRADMALYEAKAAGRNTACEFEEGVGTRIATRGQLALDMKEAMRRGEFRLVYQPVVDAATGVAVSFEALMRWHHPLHGEIPPGEFIPLAEETGLIVPLGAWALREACREAMSWPQHLPVGVNVSPIQFRSGLEQAVFAALANAGLPAHRLKLEVTESVLMHNVEACLGCLHRLRALGVLIALDDFGTGYSSLSYLRLFPFDKIKIDRAFIRDITDPDAAAIVRAVVEIGERLGMGVVAEGVETAEQLDQVRQEGCKQVQGYFFSQPLPPEEARAYMNSLVKTAA